ncbi:MAG: MbnP family protein [Saprospiraceae bacterium]
MLCLSACYQPESGCLDVEAKNFELTADEPCDRENSASSCPCIYPVLSSAMNYVVEKVDYRPDAFYRIDTQYIRIQSIQFYLSGFQFRSTSGEWISVEDTISLVVLNDENQLETQLLTDDFLLVNQQNSITMGAIKQHGTFDSLRFVLGVETPANTAAPDSITNTKHPLATTDMHTGNQETGYIFNQLIFHKDTLSETTAITINLTAATFQKQPNLMEFKMPFSYETPIGTDFSLGTLQVDHAKWFDGINFVIDTEAIMVEKIVANTPKVFSVSN